MKANHNFLNEVENLYFVVPTCKDTKKMKANHNYYCSWYYIWYVVPTCKDTKKMKANHNTAFNVILR